MTALATFQSPTGQQVRTVLVDGELADLRDIFGGGR